MEGETIADQRFRDVNGMEGDHSAAKGREPFLCRDVRKEGTEQEKEQHRGFTQDTPLWTVPLEENTCLPGVHLEESVLTLQGQKAHWTPLRSHSTVRDRNKHRGPITWLQLFAVLHHRLQAPMQTWNCFLGTEHQRRCCQVLLQMREEVHNLQDLLREKKHRRTLVPGMQRARPRQVKGKDLTKAWDTGRETIHFSVRVSWAGAATECHHLPPNPTGTVRYQREKQHLQGRLETLTPNPTLLHQVRTYFLGQV